MPLMKCPYALLLTLGLAALPVANTFATVTINPSGDTLRTAGGLPMPTSGLVILVATTNGTTFGGPTATLFASGPGDFEVTRWNLSASGIEGQFGDTTGARPLSGGLAAGQALALYWFPTLTNGASAPGAGTTYGFYRDPVANGSPGTGADNSDPWFVPSDGNDVSISFNTLSTGNGTVANSVGFASYTVNRPPVANPDAFFRAPSLSLKMAITNLLANDTDPDGNPRTFTGITGNSTNNVAVSNDANYVYYPSNAGNVADRFSYTISDGQGGVSTGLVSITISTNVVGQATGITNASGSVIASFAGIPTYSYTVQRGTNVNFTGTVTNLVTTNIPSSGLFKWTDGAPPQPTAYYRLRYNQ